MDEELKTKGWLQIDFAIEFTRWSIRGMVYLFERHARQYETLSPIDMPRRIEWLGGNERIARINLFFIFATLAAPFRDRHGVSSTHI